MVERSNKGLRIKKRSLVRRRRRAACDHDDRLDRTRVCLHNEDEATEGDCTHLLADCVSSKSKAK